MVWLDATFTINNCELANFLDTKPNESLTSFFLADSIDIGGWFLQALLAFGVSKFLTRASANQPLNSDG